MAKKDAIKDAAEDIANQVEKLLKELEQRVAKNDRVYVVAIVTTDDFYSTSIGANTEQHFAKSDKRPLDRWYFGEWGMDGANFDNNALSRLGDPTDEDIDEPGPHKVQASWLTAMIEGLRLAKSAGKMVFRGQPVTGFVTMVDHGAACWIQSESARYVNSPEEFAAIEDEFTEALNESYGEPSDDDEPDHLRKDFEKLWAKRNP